MGRRYDAEEVSGFMSDLCSALNGYKFSALDLESAYNKYANNGTFKGVMAETAKGCIDRSQRRLHKENLVIQNKVLSRFKDTKDLFEDMVDSSPKARIDTDILESVKKDFQGYRKVVTEHGANIENIAEYLQDNFSEECDVDFTQPSYQDARDAYSAFSGPNGYIDKTIKKFEEFDTDACEALNKSGIKAYIYDYQQALIQTGNKLLGIDPKTPEVDDTSLNAIATGAAVGAKAMKNTENTSTEAEIYISRVDPQQMDQEALEKVSHLLAAFGNCIGKGIEDLGLFAVKNQPHIPLYYKFTSTGVYELLEIGGAIQSYVETGGLLDTEKNAMKNYNAYQRGVVKVAGSTVSGLLSFPDLLMKINKVSENLFAESKEYIKTHNITTVPGALMNWAGEKKDQAAALWNALKDAFDEKVKTMSIEDCHEAAGYIAATIGSFYLLGEIGNLFKVGKAVEVAEGVEVVEGMAEVETIVESTGEFVEGMTKVEAIAESTENAINAANEIGEAASAVNKIEEATSALKVLEETAEVAEKAEGASQLAKAVESVEAVEGVAEVGTLVGSTEEAVSAANGIGKAANTVNKIEETTSALKALEETAEVAEKVEGASQLAKAVESVEAVEGVAEVGTIVKSTEEAVSAANGIGKAANTVNRIKETTTLKKVDDTMKMAEEAGEASKAVGAAKGGAEAKVLTESMDDIARGTEKYTGGRTEAELEALAKDPAHMGSKREIDIIKGQHEAEVGLDLERKGLLKNIRRDPTGEAEFIEENGTKWDLKGFNSYYPVKSGGFELNTVMRTINKSLEKGENIIVDTLNMSQEHITELKNAVKMYGIEDKVIFWP